MRSLRTVLPLGAIFDSVGDEDLTAENLRTSFVISVTGETAGTIRSPTS